MEKGMLVIFAVLLSTALKADILKDPVAPEVLTVIKTFEMFSGLETKFLEANNGERVLISRVSGPRNKGYFLYSSKYLLDSGTVLFDKGLFFHSCVKYSGQDEFKIDPYNNRSYLCVKQKDGNNEKLIPVGHVFQGGGPDTVYPDGLENLCTDDEYYRDRPDFEGHLTNSICDIRFKDGIPLLVLKVI